MGLSADRDRGGSRRHLGVEGVAGIHGTATVGRRAVELPRRVLFPVAHTGRIPVGIAYALWSGIGIVFITAIGWLWSGQTLDAAAMIGLGLIVAGVGVINLFSNAAMH